MDIYGRLNRNTQHNYISEKKIIIFLISIFFLVLAVFIIANLMFSANVKVQPTEIINNLKQYEKKIAQNWIDIDASLYCAREYYLLAKEDDIFISQFQFSEIPENFYLKTLYRLELLGYENISSLQEKYRQKSPDLRHYFLKSLQFINENLYEKSLKNYRKTLALSENILSGRDYFNIGMIYLKKKKYYANIAVKYFLKAIHKGISGTKINISLGNAYFMLSDFNESLKYFQKADEISGFNPIIKHNIAWIYYKENKFEESLVVCLNAIKEMKKIVKNNSEEIAVDDASVLNNTVPIYSELNFYKFYYLAGLNYEGKNDMNTALENYKIFVSKNYYHSEVYEKIGKIYYNLKNFDNARYYLNKVIELDPDNVSASELLKQLN